MALTLKGPWDKAQIDAFLHNSTFPLRLACVADDGFPRVVSVWYGYDGQHLRCVSHRSSQLVGLLQRCDRVGFELAPNEPPYHGVRGQGIATLDSDADGVVLGYAVKAGQLAAVTGRGGGPDHHRAAASVQLGLPRANGERLIR
jgi:hypothetical protein